MKKTVSNYILAFTCDICEKVEKSWVVYEKTHEDSYRSF